jgi:hypothetical protein
MPEEPTGDAFAEYGVAGLSHANGIITEEFLKELRGRQGASVYRQMSENDAIIGAILASIEATLRAVDWTVEPGGEATDFDVERAEFVDGCMHDMSFSWGDFVAEALSKVTYGWAYFEVVYKKREGSNGAVRSKFDDGRIGWRKFALRSQDTLDRWDIDAAGGINGMWQRPPGFGLGMLYIPISKALLFRTSIRKNNPEGRSALRSAYISWFRKDRVETGEMIGVDRDLVGLPMVTLPSRMFGTGASDNDKAAVEEWKRIVTQVRNGHQSGIVKPHSVDEEGNEDLKFELIASPGTRLFDTSKIIERFAKHIAVSTLQDIVLLGHEHAGSLALADTKKAMAQHALKAQLDEIANTLNQHEIPRLFRLNGFPLEDLPQVRPGEIGEREMDKIAELITATANAGMGWFPNFGLENEIRTWAGFDPVDEAEDDGTEFETSPPPMPPGTDEPDDDDPDVE